MGGTSLFRKLLWRLDGTADSAKVEFNSESGHRWEAEFCLHSGTGPQAPRLMVLLRNRSDPSARQRYTLAPPGASKVPAEAVRQLGEPELRELLATSVEV